MTIGLGLQKDKTLQLRSLEVYNGDCQTNLAVLAFFI